MPCPEPDTRRPKPDAPRPEPDTPYPTSDVPCQGDGEGDLPRGLSLRTASLGRRYFTGSDCGVAGPPLLPRTIPCSSM